MNKAKKMLLAGFLACTMLATGAAFAGCGGGSSSSDDTSTPDAWELDNATVTYTVDKDGVETANYTVVSADGEEYTQSVPTGRKVVATQGEMKVNGERFEGEVIEIAVGNEPTVEIYVDFDDESSGWVTVTDEMYIGAKPDYTKAGLYTAQFKLVDRYMAPVLVTDGEPVAVEAMLYNELMGGMCVLWDKADVVAGTYDVSTVVWMYGTYLNGEMSEAIANATAEQIKPIDWTAESEEGVYNFSVTDAAGNSGVLQAYVLDDDSETTVTVVQSALGSFSMMEQLTAVKGTQVSAIDTSDMMVAEMLMIGTDAMAIRMAELPEDAEFTLDTSVCGTQALTATWTENEAPVTAMTSVFVYENKEEVGEINSIMVNSYKVVESGVADIELNVSMEVQYTEGTGEDKNVLRSTQEYFYDYIPLTADMIKGTAPDFTTAGVKVFTVEFCGNEYTYAIELWAEEEAEKPVATTTNIASIDLPEEITLLKDQNIELYVRQNFVNQSAQIKYIEAVNGSYEDDATLKADAFDWSDVDTSAVGEYEITVTYEGYTQEITVNVVAELSEPEEVVTVATLQVEMGAVQGYDFFMIELYSDNSAMIINGNPMWGEPEMISATYELDEATGKLVLYWERWGSEEFAIVAVMDTDTDGAYDYVMPYTFGEPTVEYVINYYGEEQTLKLYEEEGYGELVSSWGYTTFSGAYTLENGILTIAGNKFYIQGTGADAQVLELKSGNY